MCCPGELGQTRASVRAQQWSARAARRLVHRLRRDAAAVSRQHQSLSLSSQRRRQIANRGFDGGE